MEQKDIQLLQEQVRIQAAPLQLIKTEMGRIIAGQEKLIDRLLLALISDGHVLLEGVPGLAKTLAVKTLAQSLNGTFSRLQFTPDLLPADVIGTRIYNADTHEFSTRIGPVFANIVLADEINRASPKTQSALLEVMEEGNVTVDGITREVPKPFIVMATQNPIGSSGTQMLPESQLDRFMICISMGYPDIRNEIAILKDHRSGSPVDRISPVIQMNDLLTMQEEVDKIFIHDVIYNYIAELIAKTRQHPMLELGVSPRGTIALAGMIKAAAYLAGRNYVVPNDVEKVFLAVNHHRIRLNSKARANHVTAEGVLEEIFAGVAKPSPKKN